MAVTLTILGCGALGTAILSGILTSFTKDKSNSTSKGEGIKISRFIACVNRPQSIERIKHALGSSLSEYVEIIKGDNHCESVSMADYVILACKPYMVEHLLKAPGMREAFHGKVLISICAGVTVEYIESLITSPRLVVRAMPNTASQAHESMTVIQSSKHSLPEDSISVINWIFSQIGSVIHLPSNQMDNATALCGSGPAFFALFLEAAIEGAVAMGLPRNEATRMAAQTMKGTAELALSGEHPAIIKDKVSSPGGCTIGGLLVLEEAAVRGHIARAVREAASIAGQLGSNVKSVNGTRHRSL